MWETTAALPGVLSFLNPNLFQNKIIYQQCCKNDLECSGIRKEHILATDIDGSFMIFHFFRPICEVFLL